MLSDTQGVSTLVPLLGSEAADALIQVANQGRQQIVLIQRGERGVGSGIVWRADGIILTNHHVVADHGRVTVVPSNNHRLAATVLASDPALDLAVLKVEAEDLPAATIGQSRSLRVGQIVLAVGNPWGQRGVVTMGIVSGVGEVRVPWLRRSAEYIRSDVQLAPGNSGGALLDIHGHVIGVNAMIFGGDLSVAIPSDVATQFLLEVERQVRTPDPKSPGIKYYDA